LRREEIPTVSSRLTAGDIGGHWRVRWGIGRDNYRVDPGVYSLGQPDEKSPVLVSANYKLSFDTLRRSLPGRDAWILVLDTDGINVWCAAGKGTFGTDELVRRIDLTGLAAMVSHRTLIVPQLGAVGVAAREVEESSGFKVVFGPVRAGDLPAFLDSGLKATPSMRRVSFTFRERLILVPMELVPALRWSIPVLFALFVLGGAGWWGYSLEAAWRNGLSVATAYAGALLAGAVATPLMLPWIPGRAFAMKGALVGLLWTLVFLSFARQAPPFSPSIFWHQSACVIALPAITAFFAMNFTGSSTITSLSGVRKEMRFALPLQVGCVVAGILLWSAGHFVKGGA
jgi:acetyl-CoA decarbonylase/synthase complex subunit gamma